MATGPQSGADAQCEAGTRENQAAPVGGKRTSEEASLDLFDDGRDSLRARTDQEGDCDMDSIKGADMGANEPQKQRANEPHDNKTRYYWLDITPSGQETWTERQKESAIAITSEDIAACAALILTEIAYDNPGYPDSFAQAGVIYTDDAMKIPGLAAAFTSHANRAKFIAHTQGTMLLSPSKDSEIVEAQVPYKVARNDSEPEMAQAMMRKESARITVFIKYARVEVTPYLINQAIESQCKGIIITSRARQNSITDAQGRPLKTIMGNKPEIHARIAKTRDTIHLPRVFIIHGNAFRYKVQDGYFPNHCPKCHQTKCECKEIIEDLERTLKWKNDLRKKQKDHTQKRAESAAASSTAPQDARTALLASRGQAGKALAMKRTAKQRATPCRDYLKGTCTRGDKCAYAHTRPECKSNRCENKIPNIQAHESTHGHKPAHAQASRKAHGRTHTHACTHTHTGTYTSKQGSAISTHTNIQEYTQAHTCAHTHEHNRKYTHANAPCNTRTHECAHVRTHTASHDCDHTLTHTRTRIDMHVHVHTHLRTSTCEHPQTHIHTYIQASPFAHKHTHERAHACLRTDTHVRSTHTRTHAHAHTITRNEAHVHIHSHAHARTSALTHIHEPALSITSTHDRELIYNHIANCMIAHIGQCASSDCAHSPMRLSTIINI